MNAIGMNIFPSIAREREDRQIDDHDDELAEHRRAPDLERGVPHDREPLVARQQPAEPVLLLGQAPDRSSRR